MMRPSLRSGLLLLLPLMSVTCGEETRFFIVQNQVPQAGCSIPSARGMSYRGEGRLDATLVGDSSAFAYDIYPLMQNDLPAVTEQGAPQPNRLTLKGFRVQVELAADAPAAAKQVFDGVANDPNMRGLLAYDEPTSGTLEPGGTVASGVGAFPAELARRLLASGVLEQVARVRATIGLRALAERQGDAMESTEFRFPLEICAGCLIAVRGSCPLEKLENPGHVCRLAQDDLVDCCIDGGRLRCPAPVAMSSSSSGSSMTTGTSP